MKPSVATTPSEPAIAEPTSGPSKKKSKTAKAVAVKDPLPSDSDSEGDPSELVHETVKPKKVKAKSQKYTPPNETPADRERRTIFVGNLPLECAQVQRGERQLSAHILTFAPSAKIESIRFRSIPFKTPTAGVPGEDEDGGKRKRRDINRASAWRSEREKIEQGGRAAEEADTSKTFLDVKGKRKVAFIKKDVSDARSKADLVSRRSGYM